MGDDLVLLDLRRTQVTDAGLAELAKMPRLRRLQLQETNVTDAGLANIKTLPDLEVLNLYDTHLDDAGLAALASSKKLRRLYVWRTAVTDAGEAKLRARLPKLEILTADPLPKPPVPTQVAALVTPPAPGVLASVPRPSVRSSVPGAGIAPGCRGTVPICGDRPSFAVAFSCWSVACGDDCSGRSFSSSNRHAMIRQLRLIAVLLAVLIAGGTALVRSSFISLKPFGSPAQDAATAALEASLPAHISFNENVGPILSENCYYCHGQDATARQANLRVDRPEFAFAPRKNGLPPIVKGHPESSAVIARITSKDPNQMMPPPSSRKSLTPEQIAMLTKWVRDGAAYQEHWAFVKPERGTPPAVKQDGVGQKSHRQLRARQAGGERSRARTRG